MADISTDLWEELLASENWKINRIKELEKALISIRDIVVPALTRDIREPDKTLCNIGTITYECAKVVPLCDFPRKK